MKKITKEEHKIIGLIFKMLDTKLAENELKIFNKQTTKVLGKQASTNYRESRKALSIIRNLLEEIAYKENNISSTGVYYGDRPKDGDIIGAVKDFLCGEDELARLVMGKINKDKTK